MRRPLIAASLALGLATAFVGGDASAEEQVRMRDGSIFQGELVERIPGDHVTIRLATGEFRRLPWSDIVSEAPVEPPSELPLRGAPRGPLVHVAVTANREGATLLRIAAVGQELGWRRRVTFELYDPVCTAPCEADVPARGRYRVRGEGMVQSSAFHLPQGEPRVGLQVNGGSLGGVVGGVVMMGFGIVAMSIGGIFMLVGASERAPNDGSGTEIGGAITLGAGAGLTGLGLYLVLANQTDVRTDRGQELARDGRANAPRTSQGSGIHWLPNGFAF